MRKPAKPAAEKHRHSGQSVIIRGGEVMRRYSALFDEMMKLPRHDWPVLPPLARAPDEEIFHQILGPRLEGARYLIRRQLGAGGMGVLYYVFDQDFERGAVMKVILPELKNDPELLADFVREARTTAQLEHANIVPVHDLGYLPERGIYFTMKYVQGETLNDVLEKREDPATGYERVYDFHALLGIFRRACDAVAFAHSRGIVHRDLKPHNIMIGSFGEVFVLDWGLARPMGEDQAQPPEPALGQTCPPGPPRPRHGTPIRTEHGIVKGSPGYMSPEQAEGDNDLLDARSDIFLLGATLYHMFTGFPPFLGNEITEVLGSARTGNYVPPEDLDLSPNLMPRELCRIVNRAMARRPADRYQNVAELCRDIDSLLHSRMDCESRHYDQGELLIREGDTGHESYIIEQGEVEVYKESGGPRCTLSRLGPGDIVGEMALITRGTRSATVVALTDCEVTVLTDRMFARNLELLPPWMEKAVVSLAARLTETDARLAGSPGKG